MDTVNSRTNLRSCLALLKRYALYAWAMVVRIPVCIPGESVLGTVVFMLTVAMVAKATRTIGADMRTTQRT